MDSRPLVFLSYSDEDEPWKDLLTAQLRVLQAKGIFDLWDDQTILGGGDPSQENTAALERAQVVIFLVSPSLLSSEFLSDDKLPRLLERRVRENVLVIPLLVRPSTWKAIDWLAAWSPHPENGRPLSLDSMAEAEAALVDLVIKIQHHVAGSSKHSIEPTVRKRYLAWLIREHGTLELPGLAQVGGRPAVELETVYVALRGDLTGSYERIQSREALEEQARKLENLPGVDVLEPDQKRRMLSHLIHLVAQNPVPIFLEERDRPQLLRPMQEQSEQTVTLGEAFRRERRLAILGDPGSGKTTLVRWLTLQLARACLEERVDVEVPLHHIDPDAAPGESVLSLGPARLPILVRVANFAEARKHDPQLNLAAFLGHHLAPFGKFVHGLDGRPLLPEDLHEMILGELESRRAVIFLDGLDEISDPLDRWEIVQEIDRFLGSWLPETERDQLSFEGYQRPRSRRPDPPHLVGGLQAVITSRIVGYQMAPLSREATHLTIEPMEPGAVDRFCDVWVRANHRAARPHSRWDDRAEAAARNESEGLKAAIAELRSRGAADLASNPLLVTILALVYQNKRGFPRQRVRLYEMAVEILLEKWQRRAQRRGKQALPDKKVLEILIPLAADIHSTSGIGVIDEAQLDQVLSQHLDPQDLRSFRTVLREEVGLLTARGEGVYGFLHLTFQEYLAARFLIRDATQVSDRVLARLSAPRWREPILMALGQLSHELSEDALEQLLNQMLDRSDPLGHLIPRALFLIIAALPEMKVVPKCSLTRLARRLLALAAQREALERFPELRKHVEQAFHRLLKHEGSGAMVGGKAAEGVLCEALRTPEYPAERWAAAELVLACRAGSVDLAEALVTALKHDSIAWNWPVDRALRELTARHKGLVMGEHHSLTRVLLREKKLAERFLADSRWLRLGIALYGGLDSGLPERIVAKQRELDELDQEIARWNQRTDDPQWQKNVDTLKRQHQNRQGELNALKKQGHLFHLEHMYRAVPWLTERILACLRTKQPSSSLVPFLEKLFQDKTSPPEVRTQALVALAALDVSVEEALRSAEEPISALFMGELSRIGHLLEIALPSNVVSTLERLKQIAAHCAPQVWTDLVSATISISLFAGQGPQGTIHLETVAHTEAKPRLLAEAWQYFVSGHQDDSLYNVAVVLDTSGGILGKDPMLLAETFARVAGAANARWPQHRGWSADPLAPVPETPLETLATALDTLSALPEPFDVIRGWALGVLAPELQRHGLLPEALALALGTLSNRFEMRKATLQSLGQMAGLPSDGLYESPSVFDLLATVERMEDPYLRFRGYWQLMRNFSDLRLEFLVKPSVAEGSRESALLHRLRSVVFSMGQAFSALVPKAAGDIDNPNHRAWAFERLAMIVEDPRPWLEEARQAALSIPLNQPEQRARALARIAPTFPKEESDSLIHQAIDACAEVADERSRAETLRLLRRAVLPESWAEARFQEVADGILDPLARAHSAGLVAPLFKQHGEFLDQVNDDSSSWTPLEAAPLALAATVHDFEKRFALPNEPAGLWLALCTRQRDQAAVALRKYGRVEGLKLGREAAIAIDWLLETGEHTMVRELLPLLQTPGESALSIVRGWPVDDPEIQHLTNLLRAEAEDLSEDVIKTLIEFLNHPEDRIRYRTALVLHGTYANHRQHLPVSRLGTRALHQLARARKEHGDQPNISQTISWTFNRLFLDDGEALQSWVAALDGEGAEKEEARQILLSLRFVAYSTWPTFIDAFRGGSPTAQRTLLQMICCLLKHESITTEQWLEMFPSVQAMDRTLLMQERILLDPPKALAAAAHEMLAQEKLDGEARSTKSYRHFLKEQQISLAEILDLEQEELRARLVSIGKLNVYDEDYKKRIQAGAEQLAANPESLGVLLEFLTEELRQDVRDNANWFQYIKSDLLLMIASAAARLPNTFINQARRMPLWSRSLREAAEYNDTFTGRQAAIILLSYLREASSDALAAIKSGLRDVYHVQKSTLDSVGRYRDVEPSFLRSLLQELYSPSPAMACSAGQLLRSLANNLHLATEMRDEILHAIARAVEDERSGREVYVYESENTGVEIRHLGRLDEIFFQILLELGGIADLNNRERNPAFGRVQAPAKPVNKEKKE